MKRQRGFINDSDLLSAIVVFGILCAIGGAATIWIIPVVWDWLRPIIHAWTA